MAKKKYIKPEVVKAPQEKSIVVNNLVLQSVDRSKKDIQTWRYAHITAESPLVPNRVRLYDLYSDVELDGHITGIIEKRIDAILNKTIYFEVGEKKVDEMDDVIESDAFRNIIKQIMMQKFWGLSGMEFLPGPQLAFKEINRKHIKPHLGIIAKEQYGEDGWKYNDAWNLWVLGDNNDLGLYLKLSPYALWKRGILGDGAQYVEIFGQPVIVMKYDTYDNKTKIELEQTMSEAGSSLRLMIPKQAEFEMIDGKQSNGDGKLFETFVRIFNNEMSVLVLGNTETTSNENGGSNAKSEVHSKQQIEITKSDLKDVLNAINSEKFLQILASYALPVEGGRFCFEKEYDASQLAHDKNIDMWLGGVVPLSDDYYYEKYGRPKPDNYDELRAKMDEEKAMQMANDNPANPLPGKKTTKPAQKKTKDLMDDEDDSIIKRIRTALSDFFYPARP